jgi:hypothetical protein
VAHGPDIGAAEPLQLALRQFFGVADDAALAASQGMSTTAVFQVIQAARARTVSMVSSG